MLKRPAVFFDRDNTLIVSDGYLGDPSKVVLVEGAADAIARLRALGFRIVVISNQSGVARGMFGEDAVRAVNERMNELLLADNPRAIVDRHESCPFHPEASVEEYRQDSDLRKPKPGMLLAAAEAIGLDLSRCWVVGDAPRDIEAGKAAGCRAVLFRDPNLTPSPAAAEVPTIEPDCTVASLKEAVDQIERHLARTHKPKILPAPANVNLTTPPAPAGSRATPSADDADFDGEEVPPPKASNTKLETLAEQILLELRRRHEHEDHDFSVTKLLAGIVQIIAVAALLFAYVKGRSDWQTLQTYILVALTLQTLTIALLIMGRQR
jgi:D-glycero-D-manno-heptose 1,7-bisphosphate phosphatase